MSANLFLRFSDAASANSPAILPAAGEGLSYGDLFALSARLAHVLVDCGVKPGDRVAVQIEKSPPALALYLATLRVGAVYLPLNTAYTLAELTYFVEDAEPALLVCDPSKAEGAAAIANGVKASMLTLDPTGNGTLMDGTEGVPAEFATVARSGDDIATILYTSGTTGRSKGAMLTHHNLLANAETLRIHWRYRSDDVLIHALPIYHAHGLFVASNVTMLAGASMYFLPKFDPDRIVALMPKATVMMGVPTFYTRLLQHPGLPAASRGMRLFVSGSAPLMAETHRAWQAATGHAILERYGMTETNMLTSNPYDGARVPGAVGPALPGVSLRVTDPETGNVLDPGEIGMIEVKGPNVFKGYWRMPEKTAAEFRSDGYFVTGDLGRIDEQGYVHIVGRGKDLIITGGFNVYPREVEAEIDAIEGVAESSVIGLPHADFGEGVTAIVVRSATGLSGDDIMAVLSVRLAKFKLPKKILFVDELPRNTMGKVQKNLLRQQYGDLYANAEPPAKIRAG